MYAIPPDFLNPPAGSIEEALTSAVRAELGEKGLLALIYLRANLGAAPRGIFVIDRKRFQNETLLIRSRLGVLLGIVSSFFPNDFQLITDDTKDRLEIRWGSFTNQRRFIRQSTTDEPRINDGSSVNQPRMNGAGEFPNNDGKNENPEKDQRGRAPARAFFSSSLKKINKKKEEDPTECQSGATPDGSEADLEGEPNDLKFSGSNPSATAVPTAHRDRGRGVIQEIRDADIPLIKAISEGRA